MPVPVPVRIPSDRVHIHDHAVHVNVHMHMDTHERARGHPNLGACTHGQALHVYVGMHSWACPPEGRDAPRVQSREARRGTRSPPRDPPAAPWRRCTPPASFASQWHSSILY